LVFGAFSLSALDAGETTTRGALAEGRGPPVFEKVTRWLPLEPMIGALDRGGFEEYPDARAFALGVDTIRREAGLFDDLEAHAIDIERDELDVSKRGKAPAPLPDPPLFEAA